MNLAALVKALGDEFGLTLVDVGSKGGLKQRWSAIAGSVRSIGFDPREAGEGPQHTDNGVVYPVAVGRFAGLARLNVTRFGNMSSMLYPNRVLLDRYQIQARSSQVVSVRELPVERLDDLLAGQCIDAIKIDAQGTELDILAGAVGLLDHVLLAEIEVSFVERYVGQPLFGDVAALMREHDFEFLDLYQLRRYYRQNGSDIGHLDISKQARSGQLTYADAVFFVSDGALDKQISSFLPEERQELVVKAMVLLLVYGKIDIAAHLLDQWVGVMDEHHRNIFRHFFSNLVRGKSDA